VIEAFKLESYSFEKVSRRIKKYILIWCSEGKIEIEIDSSLFIVSSRSLITITSGQFHKFLNTSDAKGFILIFSYDFFCKDDKDIELIFQNGLFCHFDINEIIHIKNHSIVSEQLQLIEQELTEEPFQFLTSIHARIVLILVAINRSKIDNGDEIWKPDALFLKFLDKIRGRFLHNIPVKEYAQSLSTTEQKLNDLSKEHAGKTAQQIIHGLMISEAKRLFNYENLSVKEAAYSLGFSDPFYFSNFFKKHTGVSPLDYKNRQSI
jgi:AraC-like DNA-binding protein